MDRILLAIFLILAMRIYHQNDLFRMVKFDHFSGWVVVERRKGQGERYT